MMQKRVWDNSGHFWKWGGLPYNHLWFVAVLGRGASWSLVVAKGHGGGPAGNWSRLALEARWRI